MTTLIDAVLGQETDPNRLITLLLDAGKPAQLRAKVLMGVLQTLDSPLQEGMLTAFLQKITTDMPTAEVNQLKEYYQQVLAELEQGPARPATFLALVHDGMPGPKPKIHVITPDGQERFPLLHPDVPEEKLVRGMTVFVDPKCVMVLGTNHALPAVGQEGTFLRCLEDGLVEASLRDERLMLYGSQALLEDAQAGGLKKGDRLLLSPQRQFAFRSVPQETDRRYRFVERGRIPDVVASRDIGKPHWILGYLVRRTRLLLFQPDLLARFDLRPRIAVLMTGPTGTGKTLTIKAYQHEFGRLLEQRTGRSDLGSRVIRVKVAELLSEWLGRSDKNIEELFDDIKAIGTEEVETAGGEKLRLPVVVILEEVEGLARRRGEMESGIYDRIIGTMLQRLDDPSDDLGQLPLVLLTTSNRPDLIDSAMWRRLSGIRAVYRRLDRDALAAVLSKKLKNHYPYASRNGQAPDQLRCRLIDQVVAWLFSPNGPDQGLVEITFRDGKKGLKYRRDFLTGAVVEQAVANAIDQTVFALEAGTCPDLGLSAGRIVEALQQHIDGLADNLTAHNVHDYVDLPENVPVASLRRLRQAQGNLAPLFVED